LIPYGISKLAAEKIALTLGKIYSIPSIAVRYSIVHGTRQTFRHFYSGALRVFSVQALSGQRLTIQEDGLQTRDFINVKDVTSAHLKLLEDSRADYDSFNIGSGKTTRVIDLAKMIAVKVGVNFNPIINGAYRVNTPRHQSMDISKLKSLGWIPNCSIEENVSEYVDWVKLFPEAKAFLKQSQITMEKKGIIKA